LSGGGRLSLFRVDHNSVSDFVHGECHMTGIVERWFEVENIQSRVCFSERLCAW
jgi:hypothetical protein